MAILLITRSAQDQNKSYQEDSPETVGAQGGQKRVFVELQPGHVIIGMIPATLSMQKTMHMTIIRLLT